MLCEGRWAVTEHLISRPAKLKTCPRCGEYTLTAITGGLTTATDPEPLTIEQEIAALLIGKRTFDIITLGHRLYLEWRDIIRVKGNRAYPVVAIHICTPAEPPPELPPDIKLTTAPARESLPDDPPF